MKKLTLNDETFPLQQKCKTVFLQDETFVVGEFRAYYKPYPNPTFQGKIFSNSSSVVEFLRPIFQDCMEDTEQFVVTYLSKANSIIHYTITSTGGIAGTLVDIQVILRHAILLNAKGIVLAHNHPSGNIKPSTPDINITTKLVSAAALLEITVLEHVIITANSYLSFADDGLI